ncbi:MAG TPA: CpaF family protein, partial [Pseudoalteromonas sp.]|nr:CpaF family protein [Pseudoalteromonas sp.]
THTSALIASSIQLIVHVSRNTNGVRTLKSIGEIKRVDARAQYSALYSVSDTEQVNEEAISTSSVVSFMQSQGANANEISALL